MHSQCTLFWDCFASYWLFCLYLSLFSPNLLFSSQLLPRGWDDFSPQPHWGVTQSSSVSQSKFSCLFPPYLMLLISETALCYLLEWESWLLQPILRTFYEKTVFTKVTLGKANGEGLPVKLGAVPIVFVELTELVFSPRDTFPYLVCFSVRAMPR